jgi:hypothetical protein
LRIGELFSKTEDWTAWYALLAQKSFLRNKMPTQKVACCVHTFNVFSLMVYILPNDNVHKVSGAKVESEAWSETAPRHAGDVFLHVSDKILIFYNYREIQTKFVH